MKNLLIIILLISGLSGTGYCQQVPDTVFQQNIKRVAYSKNKGPIILIDEAHNNFHTAEGRFKPFSNLLQRDGYRVRRGLEPFSQSSLKKIDILVISNALHERNAND